MPEQFGTKFYLGQGQDIKYEIMRNSHYVLDIVDIESRLACQDTTIPRYELEEVEVFYYNDRMKLAKNPNPSELSVDVLDFVDPRIVDKLWTWFKQVYDPGTRNMGYANQYKRQAKMELYDPTGKSIRTWTLKGLWPKNAPVPSAAYSYAGGQEVVKIEMKFACDVATLDDQSSSS